jgi:hypothetical protein
VCLCNRYVVDDMGFKKAISTSDDIANNYHLSTLPIEVAALPDSPPILASSVASMHADKVPGKFRGGQCDGKGSALYSGQTLSRFPILHRDQHVRLRFIPGITVS